MFQVCSFPPVTHTLHRTGGFQFCLRVCKSDPLGSRSFGYNFGCGKAFAKSQYCDTVDGSEIPNNHLGCMIRNNGKTTNLNWLAGFQQSTVCHLVFLKFCEGLIQKVTMHKYGLSYFLTIEKKHNQQKT